MANNVTTDIRYLNKDFSSFRDSLFNFAKTYFPNTYNDFSATDPGTMFIEMTSYVGDVLSYYLDTQLKEMLVTHAEEKNNVLRLAQCLGYKPKIIVSANTNLTAYQLLPADINGNPDWNYSLTINENLQVASIENSSIVFRTSNKLNFAYSSSVDMTDISVYSINQSTSKPDFYLLKKTIAVEAGIQKTTTVSISAPVKYNKILLNDKNIISIDSVKDSDGNDWYEVPYLAQDTIFDEVLNIPQNDQILSQYADQQPYLLKLKKVSRRFITKYLDDGTTEMQFGAGISTSPDEEIIPNLDNVGLMLPSNVSKLNDSWDVSNFIYSKTYGQVPQNTTLTITYTVGIGQISNVESNLLQKIINSSYNYKANLNNSLLQTVINSVAVTNLEPATGGKDSETNDEIRQNALAYFAAQSRTVTKDDYIIRTMSLPPKYGAVSKAYITQDEQLNYQQYVDRIVNPLALNLYILTQNSLGQLVNANLAVKENLKTYLSKYRILTDAINIKDAYIINIGIVFEITVLPAYSISASEVLLNCISQLKSFFNIDNWQINQPIIINDIYNLLAGVKGVQSVMSVEILNLFDSNKGYVNNYYDIATATQNNIVYNSLDPSIFEVRFPDTDIVGRTISY